MASYTDNAVHARGFGNWKVVLYSPPTPVGPIEGDLYVSKDFHIIQTDFDGQVRCIASFPSQNIAYVINEEFCLDEEKE